MLLPGKRPDAVLATGLADMWGLQIVTTFGIALGLALCLVSVTFQNLFGPRDFRWRYAPARKVLVTQTVLGLVLVAGLLWGAETEFAATLLAGWIGGAVVGIAIAALRARHPGAFATARSKLGTNEGGCHDS